MMTTSWKQILLGAATAALIAIGAGCACKSAPATTTPGGTGEGGVVHLDGHGPPHPPVAAGEGDVPGGEGHEHGGEGHEHGGLPAGLAAFHEVLRPLWHAAESPQRTTDTCNAIGEFTNRARAIITEPAPAGLDVNVWGNAAINLDGTVKALNNECRTAERAAFQPTFSQVHDAFHALMEMLPR